MALNDSIQFSRCFFIQQDPDWQGVHDTVEENLFVLVINGEMSAELNGEVYVLQAGQGILIPKGTKRHLFSSGKQAFHSWRFRFKSKKQFKVQQIYQALALVPYFTLLSQEEYNKVQHTLATAIIQKIETFPQKPQQGSLGLSVQQTEATEMLLRKSLAFNIKPRDMANEVHLSMDHFTRLFKITYGCPPKQYLMKQRMKLAEELLLESTMSVKEVAAKLQERDLGTFCRTFKKVTGLTPTQFRNL
ncbi:MAG: AraC family transcriptional regulator [Lentisphaeria bacterium]|nr:AraC family transcriptional regulator [Lentisphaeria bacterium]